jgi:hypothetical protein
MKLNCKPGDLAMCVSGEHAGKVCEVLSAGPTYWHFDSQKDLIGWIVAFPRSVAWGDVSDPENLAEGWYPDEWMRPVRDPGDDAVDETLRDLKVTA